MEIAKAYQSQQQLIKGVDNIFPRQEGGGKAEAVTPSGKVSFSQFLVDQIKQVNGQSIEAERGIVKAATGNEENSHNVLIAMQKADISFRLLMSVKERITQAYQEIMRTPIG